MAKIKDVTANHTRDMARCANDYLLIVGCPGGRPIVSGYICPHCGIDPSHGNCEGVVDFKNQRTAELAE